MNQDFSKLRGTLRYNHLLTEYTSWKIGGPAEYFYCPVDLEDFIQLIQVWQKEPITVLGAATNVLINDLGIKGLVVYLRDSLNKFDEVAAGDLRVEAGVPLSYLVQKCTNFGMIDAAFMAGIPGTLGGALKMNAGAYGKYIWEHVRAVETVNRRGEIRVRKAEEFVVSYRQVDGLVKDEWFVAAYLNFTREDVRRTKQQVQTYLQQRKKSQPLNLPSCGSVFRNPEGHYAAKLIAASGLQGRQIGGARVSEKHANFIVNCGQATSHDIVALMQEIVITVEKESGIKLIPEVQLLA